MTTLQGTLPGTTTDPNADLTQPATQLDKPEAVDASNTEWEAWEDAYLLAGVLKGRPNAAIADGLHRSGAAIHRELGRLVSGEKPCPPSCRDMLDQVIASSPGLARRHHRRPADLDAAKAYTTILKDLGDLRRETLTLADLIEAVFATACVEGTIRPSDIAAMVCSDSVRARIAQKAATLKSRRANLDLSARPPQAVHAVQTAAVEQPRVPLVMTGPGGEFVTGLVSDGNGNLQTVTL